MQLFFLKESLYCIWIVSCWKLFVLLFVVYICPMNLNCLELRIFFPIVCLTVSIQCNLYNLGSLSKCCSVSFILFISLITIYSFYFHFDIKKWLYKDLTLRVFSPCRKVERGVQIAWSVDGEVTARVGSPSRMLYWCQCWKIVWYRALHMNVYQSCM